jgi:hypothetical protein
MLWLTAYMLSKSLHACAHNPTGLDHKLRCVEMEDNLLVRRGAKSLSHAHMAVDPRVITINPTLCVVQTVPPRSCVPARSFG